MERRRENFKQMFFGCFLRYSLQIWHGYTIESPLNNHPQQLSLRVMDAMLVNHMVPQSPGRLHVCQVCSFSHLGTKEVNVWVFGQVVVTTLYPKGLTIWVAMRKLFIMTNGACITSFMQIAPS